MRHARRGSHGRFRALFPRATDAPDERRPRGHRVSAPCVRSCLRATSAPPPSSRLTEGDLAVFTCPRTTTPPCGTRTTASAWGPTSDTTARCGRATLPVRRRFTTIGARSFHFRATARLGPRGVPLRRSPALHRPDPRTIRPASTPRPRAGSLHRLSGIARRHAHLSLPVSRLFVADDSKTFVTGSADTTCAMWDTETGVCYFTHQFEQPVRAVALSQGDQMLAISSAPSWACPRRCTS